MASTYLSSRAFPSTLLSESPSLVQTGSSHPVLLPGVDSLNHARAQPVSWVINKDHRSGSLSGERSISLQLHCRVTKGEEVFNNYGPKPNSELLLGYGFTLASNPEDTIVLKIGGGKIPGQKWEIGRDARSIDGLWQEIIGIVRAQQVDDGHEEDRPDDDSEWTTTLDAADLLDGMATSLLDRLPSAELQPKNLRADVKEMIADYIRGQIDVINGILKFSAKRREEGVDLARIGGVEVEFE